MIVQLGCEWVFDGNLFEMGKWWLTLGFRGVPWAPCQSDKAICCSKAQNIKFHERTVSDPLLSLMASTLWALWPLARALGEAENSLVVSLERERHWPRCQAAHLAESQRWFYAKPWNQWRKTSKASGKRLHNELERSTMLLMGKSTISTGPCSIAMLVITRG